MGILTRGGAPVVRHACKLPNVEEQQLKAGAIFECDTCGEYWRLRKLVDVTDLEYPPPRPPVYQGQQYCGPRIIKPVWDQLGLFSTYMYVWRKGLHRAEQHDDQSG